MPRILQHAEGDMGGALEYVTGIYLAENSSRVTQALGQSMLGRRSPPHLRYFFLLAVAFLMSAAAVFKSVSVSNPSTAENLRPID